MKNQAKRGRQWKYGTPEELQAAVDRYFKQCEGTLVFDKNGVPVTKKNGVQLRAGGTPPTITGLALFLGYRNRRTFTRQKNRSQAFLDVVEIAKTRIEDYWEQALFDPKSYFGARYMLCSAFGWGRKESADSTPPTAARIVEQTSKGIGRKEGGE